MAAAESEDGWAVVAAARWKLSRSATILAEGLHIDSERGVRTRDGLAPREKEHVAQVALRLSL